VVNVKLIKTFVFLVKINKLKVDTVQHVMIVERLKMYGIKKKIQKKRGNCKKILSKK
jgi:hypothetical protein